MRLTRTITGVQMSPESFSDWWNQNQNDLRELLNTEKIEARLEGHSLIVEAEISGFLPFKKHKANKKLTKWLSDSLGVSEDC